MATALVLRMTFGLRLKNGKLVACSLQAQLTQQPPWDWQVLSSILQMVCSPRQRWDRRVMKMMPINSGHKDYVVVVTSAITTVRNQARLKFTLA